MSTTDALTITSAPDALTRYYCAKEREESAVLYINDAYLEAVDALEKLEAENAKLRELVSVMPRCWNADCDGCPMAAGKTVYGYGAERCIAEDELRELGVEVD